MGEVSKLLLTRGGMVADERAVMPGMGGRGDIYVDMKTCSK